MTTRDHEKWLQALDKLLGWKAQQDISEALRLARECKDEDAQWLVSLFPDGAPSTPDVAKSVFLAQGEDAKGLFFAARVSGLDEDLLERAAKLGHASAQAFMAQISYGGERIAWAEKAAAQRDPDGLYHLAQCYAKGEVCSKDSLKALTLFKEASELGHGKAQWIYGKNAFKESDPERYLWWGRAADREEKNAIQDLTKAAAKHLELFDKGGSGRIVFALGAACKGRVNVKDELFFGCNIDPGETRILVRAVALYDEWCTCAKRTIMLWMRQERIWQLPKISVLVWKERAVWSDKRESEK